MTLNKMQTKWLRRLAHDLKPIVSVGNHGITPALLNELEQSLLAHELVKVRLPAISRKDKRTIIDALAHSMHSEIVTVIGHMLVLYRPHPETPRLFPIGHIKEKKSKDIDAL